jgi:hypothetical protein
MGAGESDLAVDAPVYAEVGDTVTITGQLTLAAPTSPTPATLHVQRTDRDLRALTLPDVVTAADGTFDFADRPTERGPNTYRITFDGDAAHAPDQQSTWGRFRTPGGSGCSRQPRPG